MQFLLSSTTAALSSRIDAHTLAGPQRVFAFPQDVVSQASKASPEMSNYPLNSALGVRVRSDTATANVNASTVTTLVSPSDKIWQLRSTAVSILMLLRKIGQIILTHARQ